MIYICLHNPVSVGHFDNVMLLFSTYISALEKNHFIKAMMT